MGEVKYKAIAIITKDKSGGIKVNLGWMEGEELLNIEKIFQPVNTTVHTAFNDPDENHKRNITLRFEEKPVFSESTLRMIVDSNQYGIKEFEMELFFPPEKSLPKEAPEPVQAVIDNLMDVYNGDKEKALVRVEWLISKHKEDHRKLKSGSEKIDIAILIDLYQQVKHHLEKEETVQEKSTQE